MRRRKISFTDILMYILTAAMTALLVFMIVALTYVFTSSYVVNETIEVTVEDKKIDEDTYTTYIYINKIMYPQYHTDTHYYLYWEEGHVEVSHTVYNSISIGDEIIINKATRIWYDDESIISVDYTYAGD